MNSRTELKMIVEILCLFKENRILFEKNLFISIDG